MKNKACMFYVEGRIAISVGVQITAKSLEEAVEKAKSMKLFDFVEILGDHNDSKFCISGVYMSESLPTV